MNDQLSLTGAFNRLIESWLIGVHTSIPAYVLQYNSAEGRVDVKPLVSMQDDLGNVQERSTLLGVPVQMPGSSTSIVNIPIKQGDIVLLVFSMRGLDAFKGGDGTPAAPTDFRMFDKRDAIAIPGVFPFELHPNQRRVLPFNPDALSLTANIGTEKESTVELSEIGVRTQVGNSILSVTPAGVNIVGLLTVNGVPYNLHTHSGVTTGPGVSGPVVV